jgi:hypothetical protein
LSIPTCMRGLPRHVWLGVAAADQYKVMVDTGKIRPTVYFEQVARFLLKKAEAELTEELFNTLQEI